MGLTKVKSIGMKRFFSLLIMTMILPCWAVNSEAGGVYPEPVCVSAPKARLRRAPSTNSKITWVIGRHMPLERLGQRNSWSRVRDMRGQIHWVISRNVDPNATCAVVKVRTASLVKTVGENGEPAEFRVADRYTPYRRIEREGDWVRIEDEYRGDYWTKFSNLWIPVRRTSLNF